MKHEVLVGQTDYTVLVKMRDTAGAAKTALTEASIDIAYARVETDNDVTTTDVTPAALTALTDAHTDWGFEEVSATDHPGLYRLDIADAVFAAGAWSAVVTVTGTGLDPADLEFVLVNHNPQSAIADILTDTGTTLQGELDGIQADTEDIQSRLPAALVSGRIDASVGAMAANVMTAAAAHADLTTELQNGLATAAALATVDGIVDDILLDTAEIGTAGAGLTAITTAMATFAGQATLSGQIDAVDNFLDTEIAAIKAKTDNLPADPADASDIAAAIGALNDVSAAEVNAEVVDALATDTYAEPTGTPGATIALSAKISWLFMALRNGVTVTASKKQFLDDGGAAEWEKDLSDDGVTYAESEGNAP